jgi:sulfopyruvate decarboxylase subunit beta
MINALLSLTQFYELPLAIFVSRRGVYQEKIEAQFPMGRKLPGMLAGAGISFSEINAREELALVGRGLERAFATNSIHAFLMSPKVWEGSECRTASPEFGVRSSECGIQHRKTVATQVSAPSLTRYDIIKIISPYLAGKAVVSNLGWPSKELHALQHQPSNFYMLGSMGMATPIGLGIALSSRKEVVVIDGDGSLLMNPGTLATIAAAAPANLTILAIDNGAYGSTGNQPTLSSSCVDLEQVARGFGFRETVKVSEEKDLLEQLHKARKGPVFVHVLALAGNKDVPNIPVHHLEIKKQVQEFMRSDI